MIDIKKLLERTLKKSEKQPDIVLPSRCPLEGRCAKCTDACPMHRQNNIAKDGGKAKE